jgi:phosphomethylpyrimidine synthase
MKISQEVRDLDAAQIEAIKAAADKGMQEKSQEFKDTGAEIYHKV